VFSIVVNSDSKSHTNTNYDVWSKGSGNQYQSKHKQ